MAGKFKDFLAVFSSGDTDEQKKKRMEAGAVLGMVAMLCGGVFQAAWMAATQRLLGASDYGTFGPMMFEYLALTMIICLGIPQTITTFVSNHFDKDREEALKFASDGIKLVSMIALGVTLVGSGILCYLASAGSIQWVQAGVYMSLIISVAITAIYWSVNGITNGCNRVELVALANTVFAITMFFAAVALIVFAQKITDPKEQWDVAAAMFGTFGVSDLVACLVAVFLLHKTGIMPVKRVFNLKKSYGLYLKIIKFGGVTAVALVSATLLQQATPIFVKEGINRLYTYEKGAVSHVIPSTANCRVKDVGGVQKEICTGIFEEVELGQYAAAFSYGIATGLLVGLSIALLPAISEAESNKRQDLLQDYYTTAMKQSSVVLTAFFVVFAIAIGDVGQMLGGAEYPRDVMLPFGYYGVIGCGGAAFFAVLANIFIGLKKPAIPAIAAAVALVGMILTSFFLCTKTWDINMSTYTLIGYIWPINIILICIAAAKFKLHFPIRDFAWLAILGLAPATCLFFFAPTNPEAYGFIQSLAAANPDGVFAKPGAQIALLDIGKLILVGIPLAISIVITSRKKPNAQPAA